MILSPAPVQQYFDDTGALLVGGQLFIYAAATVTKQAAFTDAGGLTALPNPIVLNARAEVAPSPTGTSCGLWLDPTLAYKFVLAPANDADPPTNPIWAIDNVVSPQNAILAALAQYEATLGGVQIGSMVSYAGSTAPNGWLLCYGQAVSRTTYALLFAIIGIAYGSGDGTTTFNLPDKRGRVSIGADNMGGTSADRVTQAVSGILATQVGQAGGNQLAQQDTLAAASAAISAVNDPGHRTTIPMYNVNTFNAPPLFPLGTTSGATSSSYNDPTPSFTGISVGTTVTTTVTSQLQGQSQNMQPSEVDNFIIYTGVSS